MFSEGFICYLVIPRFVFEPRSRVALEGANVTLLCNSSGFPPPAISWNFNGGRLPNVAKKFGDGSLTLFAVRNTDDYEGNYTCRASNRAGIINTTAMLIVHGKHCALSSIYFRNYNVFRSIYLSVFLSIYLSIYLQRPCLLQESACVLR